jgi:BON domain
MHKPNRLYALTLVLLMAAGLQGCVGFGKCDPESCTGVVYLNGVVDTDFQRRSAESLVMQVASVKDVVNSIEVRNSAR